MSYTKLFWCCTFSAFALLALPVATLLGYHGIWFAHYLDYDTFWIVCLILLLASTVLLGVGFPTPTIAARREIFVFIIVRLPIFVFLVCGLGQTFLAIYSVDFTEDLRHISHPWIRAELGSPIGQILMAESARESDDPDKWNTVKKWLLRAAKSGSVEGEIELYHFLLGDMDVIKGEFNPAALPEATTWLKAAANQGDPLAENDLGCLYKYHFIQPNDGSTADKWFERSRTHATLNRRPVDKMYIAYCEATNF